MSLVRIRDLESIRFGAPDLDAMRGFLSDFGLMDLSEQPDGVLRMRANGDAPFVHETEVGEPGFRALTLRADDIEDLDRLARHDGVAVEDNPRPGGGHMVRLRDPNGFLVEVIAGGRRVTPIAVASQPFNVGGAINRPSQARRVSPGPSKVMRLGHAVFLVNDVVETWDWWGARFGFLVSDDVKAPDGNSAAMFIRCDRGDEPADHHSLNFASMPGRDAAFHHAAYEVVDFDDLMAGGEHLQRCGYRHAWGVGRHFLGSQIFDYWYDPFGNRIEHWTDGDQFAAGDSVHLSDLEEMVAMQWGPAMPAGFI